jgi:hypothetical protein
VLFKLLFPGLSRVLLLEFESGFETFTQLADTKKLSSSHRLSLVLPNGKFFFPQFNASGVERKNKKRKGKKQTPEFSFIEFPRRFSSTPTFR